MSVFRKIIVFVTICVCSLGCSPEPQRYESSLVVEGWMETGRSPIVMVSTSIGWDEVSGLEDLSAHVGSWAKVTVTCEGVEYILTGKVNEDYFPPYIYTSTELKGEEGKDYYLKVEYDGKVATAEATIPPAPNLDSLYTVKVDARYQIMASFESNDKYNGLFRTMLYHKDGIPYNSLLGLVRRTDNPRRINAVVNRGVKPYETYDRYFDRGDSVLVFYSHINDFAFDFWSQYENVVNMSSYVGLSSGDIPSNINGGMGYWFGYGTVTKQIIVE